MYLYSYKLITCANWALFPIPWPRACYTCVLPSVESTFSQAAAPPNTSSTSFSLGNLYEETCSTVQYRHSTHTIVLIISFTHFSLDVLHIRTCVASKPIARRAFLHRQEVSTSRTKQMHSFFLLHCMCTVKIVYIAALGFR